MVKIVVNADDFGLTKSQTHAIIEAFKKGYISNTTMCANGNYYEQAIKLVEVNKLNGRIGVHINVTEGKPITKEILKEPFFCKDGVFHGKINRYKLLNKKQKKVLYNEIEAQIQKIKSAGINITHIDSHNHIHTAILILPIFLKVMKQNNISKIRIYKNIGSNNILKNIMKFAINNVLKKRYDTVEFFGDVNDLELLKCKKLSENAKIEIMVHPDYSSDNLIIDKVYTINGVVTQQLDAVKEYTDKYKLYSYNDISEVMKVLYVYSNCSKEKYKTLFLNSKEMILQQAQKYHSLLIEGLRKNNIEVKCISGLPINRRLTKKIIIKGETEIVNDIKYLYYTTINMPILRQLFITLNGFIQSLKICKKEKDIVLICDVLNIANCVGAIGASKIYKKKCVGIVTDVPGVMVGDEENNLSIRYIVKKIREKVNKIILNNIDAYVFLTEPMNKLINRSHKPYVVLEGHVDIDMKNINNKISEKNKKKVILYAGSLKKIYGINILVEAFINCGFNNTELHIYGDGDFTNELIEICKLHNSICYLGVKPNQYIVNEQLKAILLVNPRPTKDEYTKYSFPSKNMEYMASGTPLLTTKFKGMPKEYEEYVYLIEDETVHGMQKALISLLNKSNEELHLKGQEAKKFVLEYKNNIVQAHKIVEMIKEI